MSLMLLWWETVERIGSEHQNCNNFVSFIEPLKPVYIYLLWIFFK